MKLAFLGTRGEIEARTARHRMHSALLVSWRNSRVMIDCGADWRGRLSKINPTAIVITHAHPDHAGALKDGAPCPVFATRDTWDRIRAAPATDRIMIAAGTPFEICGILFEAFSLEHSLRAPAVGYRMMAGAARVFYAPDVVSIRNQRRALSGIALYIGDGASLRRAILRKRGERLIGHASIRTQLEWCRAEGVRRAVFTHCGSQIVERNPAEAEREVAALGNEAGVAARVAFDGLELVVRPNQTD